MRPITQEETPSSSPPPPPPHQPPAENHPPQDLKVKHSLQPGRSRGGLHDEVRAAAFAILCIFGNLESSPPTTADRRSTSSCRLTGSREGTFIYGIYISLTQQQ